MQELEHPKIEDRSGLSAAEVMQEDLQNEEDGDFEPPPLHGLTHGRALAVLGVLLLLVLMAVIPPLLNVSRYRRQIASSIGASLGRPVRIDSVTLNVLPLPGFTLQNFVVDEDPAFGAEPVIRANEVRATLRLNSLWRRRVEFSKISLDDPSVNLVHLPSGQWNLESILLQASRMPAAPTQQKRAGDAPRFPYIEATGARVNIKMGLEKIPLSLTEAEFALWLPEPEQWHLRLKAHLARTDTASTDTGTLRVEGTLGQASSLAAVPVSLNAEWSAAPLGAVSRVLTGSDAGLRGEMTLSAAVQGTIGENAIQSKLELRRVRRADFVPAHTLDADVSCTARTTGLFRALKDLRCAWPAESPDSGLIVTGDVPSFLQPASANLQATLKDVPVSTLLDALRVANSHVSPEITAAGTLAGSFTCCAGQTASPPPRLVAGSFSITKARFGLDGKPPILEGDVQGSLASQQLVLDPVPLALGGKEPARLQLGADASGLSLHLTGPVLRSQLLDFADALPLAGGGLAILLPEVTPTPDLRQSVALQSVNLEAVRPWDGEIVWTQALPPKPAAVRRNPRHRH